MDRTVSLYDPDAEAALLGATMLSAAALEATAIDTTEDDYQSSLHRAVFRRIVHLHHKGEAVDVMTVASGRSKDMAALDVRDLAESCMVPQHWPTYLQRVREASRRRALAASMAQMRDMLLDGADPDLVWAEYERLQAQGQVEPDPTDTSLALAADDAINALEAAAQGDSAMTGVSTGLPTLDRAIGGLTGGNTYVVAGESGKGKTQFACNLALAVAGQGVPVYFLSLEMTGRELTQRLLGITAQVDVSTIRYSALTGTKTLDDEWRRLVEAQEFLSTLPMVVDDASEATVGYLRRKAKKHEPGLLIVDYLQLMSVPRSRDRDNGNREQEVATISGGLKAMSKDFDMPVVALAQLNRGPAIRGVGGTSADVQLQDLRESSRIGHDATVVLAMEPKQGHELRLGLVKNRHGQDRSFGRTPKVRWVRQTGEMHDDGWAHTDAAVHMAQPRMSAPSLPDPRTPD